jgi:hypothetical protein
MTAMRVVGNKEGNVDKEGNGNSNKDPTVQSHTTTKQQSISGWQVLGWDSRGKAWRLIYPLGGDLG